MTDNIVRADFGTKQVQTDEYFGGCPHCGKTDGYADMDQEHWFVCDAHRVRWFAGTNLFSVAQDPKSQETIAAGWKVMAYAVIEPVYPPIQADSDTL